MFAFTCDTTALQLSIDLNLDYSTMPATKTATLNLRIDPAVKDAVKIAADRDHRSVANFMETLIRKHCKKVGIKIPTQQQLFEDDGR
jgi:hypothetical protein